MKTILVVCTANICRSPMAAALLRNQLAEEGLDAQVQVVSAGVFAREGLPASEHAVTVLAQRGAPLAGHRSQPVSVSLLEKVDLVLTMEEGHRRSLFYLSPQSLNKIYLLSEMAGRHEDVEDPYGGELNDYVYTVGVLEKLITAGMPNILKRLKITPPATNTSAA